MRQLARIGLAAAGGDQRAACDDLAEIAPLLLVIPEIGDDAGGVRLDLDELGGGGVAGGEGRQDHVDRQEAPAPPHAVPAQLLGHGQCQETFLAQAGEVLLREGRRLVVFPRARGEFFRQLLGAIDHGLILRRQREIHAMLPLFRLPNNLVKRPAFNVG